MNSEINPINMYTFNEIAEVNPPRTVKKGTVTKYLSMDSVNPRQKHVSKIEYRKYNGGSKFKKKDILFARITPSLEHGKTCIVDFLEDGEIGAGSTEFIVISSKDGLAIPDYLYYLTTSNLVREPAIKSMTGTSGRQRVDTSVFDSIIVPIPPLKEQKAIAKILSDLDSKIELNQKMNKTLEAIAQAIFKHWFIDFEFPNEDGKPYKSSEREMVDSELGEIPKNWTIKKLDEIANFLNGLALQKYPAITENDYLPVIKIKEMNSGISESSDKASRDIPSEYIVHNGDVLFAWSGSLGVIIWCSGEGALNQHIFKVSSDEYPKWFYYKWLLHYLPDFIEIARDKATTMGHIQRHHLSESLVAVPDSNTLEIMNNVLEPIIDRIINLRVDSDTLTKTRDLLLPPLLSGKIRVPLEE